MKRVLVGVVLLAVVLGSGGYAYAQSRTSGPSYRSAVAQTGTVERTLALTGTVSSTGRRDLSFGTAGTVDSVKAHLGQHVRRGQVLATLAPAALDAQVTSATATLAKARAQLASDETAQATAVTTAATTSTSTAKAKTATKKKASIPAKTTPSKGTAGTSANPGLTQALAALAKQQQAVTGAQSTVSAAITDAKDNLTAQQAACQQTQAAADPTPSASPSATPTQGAGLSQACTDALAAVQAAQQTVSTDQDALQVALNALGSTLTTSVKALGSTAQQSQTQQSQTQSQTKAPQTSTPSSTKAAATPSASSGSATGGSAGAGRSVTAATLARDQAQIDTAQADLGQAQASRALGTLRAPYAGRVLQRSISAKDLVSASTSAFVLVGKGVTEVSSTLSSAQVADVRRGQRVTVTPAGWSTSLSGVVEQVGLLADDSGNHTLTVLVESQRTVGEGSTASLSVVVGTARDAVVVPTSAVTRLGTRSVVQVLQGSTVSRVAVTVGVLGARRTSLTSGLKAGQRVVLADLGAALPTGTSTTGTRRAGLGGGFGGGGFGGGARVGVQRGG